MRWFSIGYWAAKMSRLVPNFFILGPPKCGTSSLFSWLQSHPQICGSKTKETYFLMDPDTPLYVAPGFDEKGLDGYSEYFTESCLTRPVRIDATTHHLFQRTALRVISGLDEARVCVVLRDPAERMLSAFNYAQNNQSLLSSEIGFDRYLDRAFSKKAKSIEYCKDERGAYVLDRNLEYGKYANYIEPWLDSLGRDRVHWVLFEDFRRRPRELLKELMSPFDIDSRWFDQCDLARQNETYRVRSQVVHRWARRLNSQLETRTIKPILKKVYLALQKKRVPKNSETLECSLERLRRYYQPYNRSLEQLLSVDLSSWKPKS